MKEVATAIWKLDSGKPGKTITILGGTHGNERTGIEVVKKLKAQAEAGEFQVDQGKVFLILGNLQAIELNERGSKPHQDMNRCFHQNILEEEPGATFEEQRAATIAPFLQQSDIVLDLHATNKPSEPFLACLDSPEHKEVYRWFTCDKVLADPDFVLGGLPVTTDEFTESHGGIGICYETGLASDLSRVDAVMEDVLNVLRDQDVLAGHASVTPSEKEVYKLTKAIMMEEGFEYVEGMGAGSWQRVNAGDIIGKVNEKEIRAEEGGVIIFPKPPEHRKIGKPVGYLARKVQS